MESIIHADIFFFIASLGFILFAILFTITALYVIRILHDVQGITGRVKKGVERVADSAEEVIDDIKHDGIIATVSKIAHQETKKRRIIRTKK